MFTPSKKLSKKIKKGVDIRWTVCYFESANSTKGGWIMGTEAERQDTRKAMAYDLINIIDEKPEQETYTAEEVKKMIRVYVSTADQK